MKKLIILIGIPGSGKSSLWDKEFGGNNYFRVSQDFFQGKRDKMIAHFLQLVKDGVNIVIDRTNISVHQRKDFIKVARENGYNHIEAIYLNVDPNVCITRISKRESHETIAPNTPILKISQIVNKFHKSFETPTFKEGFDAIEIRRF